MLANRLCTTGLSLHTIRANLRLANKTRSRAFSSTAKIGLKSSLPARARYVRFGTKDPSERSSFGVINLSSPWTRFWVGFGIVGGLYYVSHLEQVPETGRWRFMDVNPSVETELAKHIHEQILKENRGKILPANHPLTKTVRQVATQLLQANNLGHLSDERDKRSHPLFTASRTDEVVTGDWVYDSSVSGVREGLAPGTGGREWKLVVVHDPEVVNAEATYGNIIIYTGIFQVCHTDDELAAVLAHEMGHVVARHVSERYSTAKYMIAISYLIAILAPFSVGWADVAMTLLLELPMSRKYELEADMIGMKLSAKACFMPEGAISMFSKLDKLGDRIPDFLATHPSGGRRAKLLQEMLPEAYAIQAATPECAQVRDMRYAMQNFW